MDPSPNGTCDLEDLRAFTKTIAIEAGQLILRMRSDDSLVQDRKGGIELVTSADHAASQLIVDRISEQYPGHSILSEESENAESAKPSIETPTWIIDPIDGTVSYARGHFHFAVSIAFCDKGVTQVGVVYCPALNEMFEAVRGEDALLNGKRIAVSDTRNLDEALVATGFPYGWEGLDPIMERFANVRANCCDMRRSGSAATDICWIACGRVDAYYEDGLKSWDVAAAKLIAKQAGASFGFFLSSGNDVPEEIRGPGSIVTTPHLFEEFKGLLV